MKKCETEEGVVCSGHGKCECGLCHCESGYIGEHCACRNRDDCGSHGDAVCDPVTKLASCKCKDSHTHNDWYYQTKRKKEWCSCEPDIHRYACKRQRSEGNGGDNEYCNGADQ